MFKKSIFKHLTKLFIISILLLSANVQAKTVVLVHGFLADGMSWRTTGFTVPLRAAGFLDGGNYSFNQWGMMIPRPIRTTDDAFFTVDLPSQTNLQSQESILVQYLQHLYSQRLEPITLLGHSAGGVVARLYVLDPSHIPVNGLITIASPHLGTPTANVAYIAGNSPIGMMASMVGGDELQDSRGLFSDLKEEEPNTFLYWMNHQPHPNIHYASIIRNNETITKPNKFDFVVPPNSQNMNNVWGLKGRSGVALSKENHFISGVDGLVAVDILRYIK